MRSYKKVNGVESYYQYLGDKLIYEKRGDTELRFGYNSFGNLSLIAYTNADGTTSYYYVVCNSRGDVEALYNCNGELRARYVYDSWANTVSILNANGVEITSDTSIGKINPIRYRGYYYDSETGMYYLKSRYYNPEVGRFINADGQLATDVLGLNLFSYCENNPIARIDTDGQAWYHWAIGAAIVVACAVAVVVTAGGVVAGIAAVAAVGSGVAAATTASTIAAGAFIGSATVYGMSVLVAASTSSSVKDFNDQGNWKTVAMTAGSAVVGGGYGYVISKSQTSQSATTSLSNSSKNIHTSGTGNPNKNANPNGSYTKLDNNGSIYSYTQFDSYNRQTLRIDFKGRPHAGVLPHIHVYSYPERGGRVEYVFDIYWNLID